MKVTSLKLRGFIGIKKGMNLDEISLDFSNLSGLIALSGENGNGKTSIMDCLHPYRQLSSRAGALQRHVFLRDSIKELCFEFAGDSYRTLIKIDSDSDRTEGFIWKNNEPQVNGKVSEYDKYVVNLFGSSQLFFSSVFCAQNAEKISDMTTSELKKLFSEFLRLDRLVEFENTAKQCVTLLTAKAEGLHQDITAARESLIGTEELDGKLARTEASIKETKQLIQSLTRDLKEAESELEAARVRAAANTSIRQRVQDLEATAARIESEVTADTVSSEKELSILREKARGIMAEIAAAEKLLESKDAVEAAVYKLAGIEAALSANAALRAKIDGDIELINSQIKTSLNAKMDAEDRLSIMKDSRTNKIAFLQEGVDGFAWEISEKQHLLKEKDSIDAAVKAVEEIKAATCSNSKTVEDLHAVIDPMNDSVMALSIEISNAKRELSEVTGDPSIRIMEAKIKGLNEKMADLDKKDPACTSTTCSFIVGALAAKEELAAVEVRLLSLRNETAEKTKAIQALIDQKNEELGSIKGQLEEAITQRKAATAESFRLQAELSERQSVANIQPQLAIAEARISDLSKRKADTEAEIKAIQVELEEKTAASQTEITEKNKQIAGFKEQLQEIQKDKIEKEAAEFTLTAEGIETKIIADDQSKIAVAEARLADLNQRKNEAVADGKRIRLDWDSRIGSKRTELHAVTVSIQDVKGSIDVLADNKMLDAQSLIESHRLHLNDETAGMARQEAQVEALRKEIEAKDRIESTAMARTLEYDRVKNEIAEWLYLKNACSKDGLRALEIDSVAPIISGYANDILIGTFGPAYTVKLRTQDENNKEVLDILSIREDGSEVNIENLSGGEQVWSLKALRLAMLLISKEKSGREFKTMFCDENDGALSTGKAVNFTNMYRSLMKIANIETCFFISHKEETVCLADHIMKFGKNGIQIN